MMVRFKEELVKALTRARLQIEEAKPEEGKTDPKVSMNLKFVCLFRPAGLQDLPHIRLWIAFRPFPRTGS